MNSPRLRELSNNGKFHDYYYFTQDENRLYPAFGHNKVVLQTQLRRVHRSESNARMSKIMHDFANLTVTPEKEADWAIMGGFARGIGGVGAGIAAAAQTQINNAGVRQRNAERAAQAASIHSMADNVESLLGKVPEEFYMSSDEAADLGFSAERTTAELFSKLLISYGPDETAKLSNEVKLYPDDHHTSHQRFKVEFSTNHDKRIDGYVLIELKNAKGRTIYEKILPLPLMGVGHTMETAIMGVSVPGGLHKASFKPLALWEITDKAHHAAPIGQSLPDLPADHPLRLDWDVNLHAHQARAAQLEKDKRTANIKMISIITAISAAVVIGLISFFTAFSNNSTFDFGCIYASSWPQKAHEEYFSKLPKSYHERIAEEYLDRVRSDMRAGYTLPETYACLEYASMYACTDAQRRELNQLYADVYIHGNGEGTAKDFITSKYQAGEFTAQEVTAYAQRMYAYIPDRYGENNNMQADALALVNLVKHEDATAAQLSTEWDQDVQAHAAAIESFKARDYAAALAFFAEHKDVEHGWEYYGFSKAAVDLFGTWKDSAGNTLIIAQDPAKELEYMTFSISQKISPMPYQMPLSITYNGQDISYCQVQFWSKGTKQCTLSLNIYEYSNKVAYDMKYVDATAGNPYRFGYDSENRTLTVTHQSDAYKNSKGNIVSDRIWERTFTRID